MNTIFNSDSIMLDLETLGTRNNAPIIQIGAVVFNKDGIKKKVLENIKYDNETWDYFKCDFDTIKWWMSQDKEVSKSVFNPAGSCDLSSALSSFRILEAKFFWAKSTSFDYAILDNAFKTMDMRSDVDFRNIVDMRDIYHLDPEYAMPERHANAHNALEDAVAQAEYVIEWMNSRT